MIPKMRRTYEQFLDPNAGFPDFSNWRTYCLYPSEYVGVFALALALTIARINIQKYFTDYAVRNKIKEDYKFSESCWKVLFYIISLAWGLYNALEVQLFSDKIVFWKGCPHQEHSESMTMFYIFELGFYVHSTYCHMTMEVKRKDFWPLFFHHLVTMGLIYFSLISSFLRVGVAVVVLHDIGDIPLELGKIAVYRNLKIQQTFWYIIMVIAWLATRLGMYPTYIINSVYYAPLFFCAETVPFYLFFLASLVFLQFLHVYWFILIIRIGYRTLTGKEEEFVDVREKDD